LKNKNFRKMICILFIALTMVISPSSASAQETKPPTPDNWPKPMDYFGLLVPNSLENPFEDQTPPDRSEMEGSSTSINSISMGEIVYQTYVYGTWDIYHTDESRTFTNIMVSSSNDVTPRLNRGATKVVFASDKYTDFEILSKDIASGTIANLTNNSGNDYTPEWSPDGSKIVFVGMSSSTNPDIYRMNANGTNITKLTTTPIAEKDYFPTWSPDGNKIMWVKADGNGLGAIWIMNADGSNQVAFSNQIWYMQHPIWSKDGMKIAFDADVDGDGWNELASVNSDGSNFQVVLDLNTNLVEPWAGSWSPNGGTIYFTKVSYSQNSLGELSIYSVNVGRTTGYNRYSSFTTTGYDMNPDYKSIELLPPNTSITPLPQQSPFTEFSISCVGTDQGPSGIGSYEFQYRILPSLVWTTLPRTTSSRIKFSPTLSTSGCFRCRAIDNVYNIEAWPAEGTEEACTSFYSWDITGKISDNRGETIKNAIVDINPDPGGAFQLDDQGVFSSRLVTEGTQTISVNSGGVETNLIIDDVDSPMNLTLYTIPSDTIIQNGGFENGMDGWVKSGILDSRLTNEVKVTGQSGFEIGSNCSGSSCISSPEELGVKKRNPSIAIDSQGQVHLIYESTQDFFQGIYYSFRNTSGVWSSPVFLDYSSTYLLLKIDDDQTLHAVWPRGYGFTYVSKKPGESWSQPETIYSSGIPHLEFDDLGRVHLFIWTVLDGLREYIRSPQGVWSGPKTISYFSGLVPHDIVKSDDGSIHIGYADLESDNIYHLSIRPDGNITLPDVIFSQPIADFTNLSLSKAPDDSIYYMAQVGTVAQNGGAFFGIRDQHENSNQLGYHLYDWSKIVTDDLGVVNQFASQGSSGYYLSRSPEGVWDSVTPFFQDAYYQNIYGDVVVDDYDMPHILMHKAHNSDESLSYFYLKASDVDDTGSLSQTVKIPLDMHNPTLAFMYRTWRMTPESQSGLHVQVEEEGNLTTVLDVGYATDWKLAWVDLSPWTGKTITVKLTLDQQSEDPFVKFYLDDISLGSFTTPWIESVEPAELITYDQDVVTIHGGNFFEPLNLFLNQISVTDFTVFDDQTIQFNLPDGIGPGVYDVTITTPIGQKAELHSGLRLGLTIFMPAITR
jgi:hypothetical protein